MGLEAVRGRVGGLLGLALGRADAPPQPCRQAAGLEPRDAGRGNPRDPAVRPFRRRPPPQKVQVSYYGPRGFALLPRPWVAERSFGWTARFRRLARDYERPASTLEGLHCVAFSIVMLKTPHPSLRG